MHISSERLKQFCRKKKLVLKDLLFQAGVSRTAYYSLLRKDTVLPQSVCRIAKRLGAKPSEILEEEGPEERQAGRLQRKLDRVMTCHPKADRDNVLHTLRLLEIPPIERLKRGLLRAQKFNFHR